MGHENILPYPGERAWAESARQHFLTSENGKPFSVKLLRYLMQKHGKAAGIPVEKSHPHSFRRTFCISFARADVPLHAIQELTGHKMLNTLSIYLKVTQKEADTAIARLPTWNKHKRGQPVFTK